jgi:hypothetical protein
MIKLKSTKVIVTRGAALPWISFCFAFNLSSILPIFFQQRKKMGEKNAGRGKPLHPTALTRLLPLDKLGVVRLGQKAYKVRNTEHPEIISIQKSIALLGLAVIKYVFHLCEHCSKP